MKNQAAVGTNFSPNQINALIHLLSDPDPKIAQTIHEHLVSIGHPAMALLQRTQGKSDDPVLTDRLQAVVADIKRTEIEHAFKTLVTAPNHEPIDLQTGAFLIAQAGNPDLHVHTCQQQIGNMVESLRQRWEPDISPLHAIQTINQYLFQDLGFTGNSRDYYDPDNSFLDQVLERRVGIPISLSVLYVLIGQRLNVPVAGIGLPGHFMVGLRTEPMFIDCFNQGKILSQQGVANFLKTFGVELESQHLIPPSNKEILARMLRNLVAIYHKRHEPTQADRFNTLLSCVLSNDAPPEHE